MINKSLVCFIALNAFTMFAQDKLSPEILVLSPNMVIFEKSMEKELSKGVSKYTKRLDLNVANDFLKSEEFKQRPANFQEMGKSEVAFLSTLDYKNLASYLTEQFLSHKLSKKLKNVVVRLSTDKSSDDKNALAKISNEKGADFVINLSLLEFYKSGEEGFLKMTVQLYERETGELILNKSFTGDWSNPGSQYACEERSVNCCINNALSQAVTEMSVLILEHDPTLKKANQTAAGRKTVLLEDYYKRPFDKAALGKIIPSKTENIDPEHAYQLLFNADKTKFVAFFTEPVPANGGKDFHDRKNDHNIQVESEDQLAILKGKYPNTYGYIVKGVLYKDQWYYEKAAVTYFDSKSLENGKQLFFSRLEQWNFFVKNTAEVNPGFWEATGKSGHTLAPATLFEKVPDLTKDPDWEKNKDFWKSQEQENRPYIGMYEIVADQLKARKNQ